VGHARWASQTGGISDPGASRVRAHARRKRRLRDPAGPGAGCPNHRRMRDVAPAEKTSGLSSRAAASSKPRLSTSGFVAHMFADQRA
jgi:hypothetical protein